MISVKEITIKQEWEKFVLSQPYTLFVQSANYGSFYEQMGEDYWIVGVYKDDKLIGGSLVVKTTARRGSFLYLPYGPLLDYKNREAFVAFWDYLKQLGKREGMSFIRTSPFFDDNDDVRAAFVNVGLRPAPMHVLAETTWMLDLHASEDELLKNMKKNHRNLVRRCEREGAYVKIGTSKEMFAAFNDLHDETAKRHKFVRFSRDYIEKEFKNFVEDGHAYVFNGHLSDGTLHSSAIIMMYGSMAVYRHGASLSQPKNIPTSYLVQWEIIRTMKQKGIRWYNFWGIAPDDAPKGHPFKGITHFKRGFGGTQKDLLPAHDLPLSPKYYLNWAIETVRRIKRGF